MSAVGHHQHMHALLARLNSRQLHSSMCFFIGPCLIPNTCRRNIGGFDTTKPPQVIDRPQPGLTILAPIEFVNNTPAGKRHRRVSSWFENPHC